MKIFTRWIILVISYILVAILTALSVVFIGYQVFTLFAPYLFSKIFGMQVHIHQSCVTSKF